MPIPQRLTVRGAGSAAGIMASGPRDVMNGSDVMPDTPELSEARRALLEKYVRGDLPQVAVATGAVIQHVEADVSTPREHVVAIQTGGSKRPFFF